MFEVKEIPSGLLSPIVLHTADTFEAAKDFIFNNFNVVDFEDDVENPGAADFFASYKANIAGAVQLAIEPA